MQGRRARVKHFDVSVSDGGRLRVEVNEGVAGGGQNLEERRGGVRLRTGACGGEGADYVENLPVVERALVHEGLQRHWTVPVAVAASAHVTP